LRGGAILPVILAGLTPILLLAFLASGIGFGSVAWQPPILWTDTLGSITSRGDNGIIGVSSDSSGVYSAGYTNYSGIGYPGGTLLIAKYDSGGNDVWTHTIGNSSTYITGISVGTDGIYLAGDNLTDSGFVEKFNFAGNRLWTLNSSIGGGTVATISGVSATTSGVYIAGDPTIQEYDLNGNLVWTSQLFNVTSTTTGRILSVYADTSGVYVTGYFSGNLTGQTQVGGGAFLAKYSLSSALVWARELGTDYGQPYSISSDAAGVYVSGNTYLGPLTEFGWLQKYDFNGNLEWAVRIDSPDGSGMGDSSIFADESGVYVSMGSVSSKEYLMKYGPEGGQMWSFQMQGRQKNIYGVGNAYRLSATSGALYVAGSVVQNGNSEGFVSRVSTSPSLVMFGLNPPLSFIVLGGLIGGSVVSLVTFRRQRRKGIHPKRVGPSSSSLPTTD